MPQASSFLAELSAPASRALQNAGLNTLRKLSKVSVRELLALHGMGPASLPKLRAALKAEGLAFHENKKPAKVAMKKGLAEKLSLKPGLRAFFKNAPAGLRAALEAPGLDVGARFTGVFDRLMLFTKTRKQLDREFPRFKARLAEGGILWIAWPKGGGLGTDLKVPEVIRIGYSHGLVESVNLSVDETWTALKFTWPKPGKVYRNRYGKLPENRE